MMTFGDAPPEAQNPHFNKDQVMYAHMQIGDSHIMASDAPNFQPMRSVYLSFGVHSNEDAERIYNLLKEGGEIFMPMAETFFAYRFAMLRDRFGVSWMVIHGGKMGPQ